MVIVQYLYCAEGCTTVSLWMPVVQSSNALAKSLDLKKVSQLATELDGFQKWTTTPSQIDWAMQQLLVICLGLSKDYRTYRLVASRGEGATRQLFSSCVEVLQTCGAVGRLQRLTSEM